MKRSFRKRGGVSTPGVVTHEPLGRAPVAEPWASLLALASARLDVGDYDSARAAFCELGDLRPDLCEAWAGAAVAAHLQGDGSAARTFRNMLEASCPPRSLLGWVQTMVGVETR